MCHHFSRRFDHEQLLNSLITLLMSQSGPVLICCASTLIKHWSSGWVNKITTRNISVLLSSITAIDMVQDLVFLFDSQLALLALCVNQHMATYGNSLLSHGHYQLKL